MPASKKSAVNKVKAKVKTKEQRRRDRRASNDGVNPATKLPHTKRFIEAA